jgi:hypothetical protein
MNYDSHLFRFDSRLFFPSLHARLPQKNICTTLGETSVFINFYEQFERTSFSLFNSFGETSIFQCSTFQQTARNTFLDKFIQLCLFTMQWSLQVRVVALFDIPLTPPEYCILIVRKCDFATDDDNLQNWICYKNGWQLYNLQTKQHGAKGYEHQHSHAGVRGISDSSRHARLRACAVFFMTADQHI